MILIEESSLIDHVYFPLGPLISLKQVGSIEVALVGSEGLVGWTALAGCTRSPYRAVVGCVGGTILKVGTHVLTKIASEAPALALVISRFVNVINVQMSETIGAYAFHRTDMRLARWLLLRHDRLETDDISVNHDEIAENLGARRASITDCLHVIEGDGLVRCRRGRITIRDRSGLEALATGCYGAAESFYRETIGDFGKDGASVPATGGPGVQKHEPGLVPRESINSGSALRQIDSGLSPEQRTCGVRVES